MDGFFEKTVEYPAIDLPGVLNRSCRACVVDRASFVQDLPAEMFGEVRPLVDHRRQSEQ